MNIYVGRLPQSITEAQLRELFEGFGEITSVKLIKDRFTGEMRGFGFVEIASAEHAQAAIDQLNGSEVDGSRIVVTEAREKEDRPRRTFGGGNGGGYRSGGNGGGHHRGGGSRFGGNNGGSRY